MFKVKYCHKIFDEFHFRNCCHALLLQALKKYEIRCKDNEIGFNDNQSNLIYFCYTFLSSIETFIRKLYKIN